MISSISPNHGVDSYSVSYAQFNNNEYLNDKNLNSVQSDHLQRITKKFSELGSKMGPSDINCDSMVVATRNDWSPDTANKMTNDERLSPSTEDSDSSGSFKHGIDHAATLIDKNDEKPLPDHHARRPMNAFLIFCKRHRAIVRERYPNLENRAITKILGDWWANLDETEKSSYTNLAKEYKDAFFNANPDFKWYKLPAPPIRTGYQRMCSNDRQSSFSDENGSECDILSAKIPKRHENSTVTTFKLADEAQMGGLSSLMVSNENGNGKCANNNDDKFITNNMKIGDGDAEKDGDISDLKDELHRVLGETRSFLQTTMKEYENSDEYSFDSNATTNNNIPRKSFHSSSSTEMKNFEFDSPDDDVNGYDSVFGPKKSSRACKGKRYMEFMNAQKLNVIGKRTKPRTTSASSSLSSSPTEQSHAHHMHSLKKSISCSQAGQKFDYDHTFDHLYANHSAIILPSTAAIKNETDAVDKSIGSENPLSPNESRKFDVTEFELDQKINALRPHNLDEYLVRKQDTKKKKKVNDKRSSGNGYRKVHKVAKTKAKPSTNTAHTVTALKTSKEAKAQLAIVGSQKRKARKESITRRDVQQVTAFVQSFSAALEPQNFMPMTSVSVPISIPFTNLSQSTTNRNSGLLMLATMAEVAAANYAV
ncbi:uncharacterized protein LOC116342953 [Contarinia nasturtii]|uniref:uncharacterized protein LOC116342953 n=1 Tax=Contarinia nasturtii TaxID=265458 RepID=UPI0012D410B6|nr:uncharacterized protein LOC116342953 [Contarinia nasturtii]XP_031626646.1 uncharacterized protein LOC116342953 [Contarinia nasturtii]XP_031626647.1 uncharacterized protein LOC116342953 [Contarinia nasturtii]XP_031626648.1 uncharacterized protein LOC116342953 [Contarinia nasturtii]